MLLELLAAAAVAHADGPHQAGWKPPVPVRRPSPDELSYVWPMTARGVVLGGRVLLDCQVGIQGDASDCRVLAESPPGFDFGYAALKLQPRLRFLPATQDGKPVAARVTIPIDFKGSEEGGGPPIKATAVVRIEHPVWVAAPGFSDVAAVYPRRAAGAEGHVAFICGVAADGALRDCEPSREEPAGVGFVAAARGLIPKFRMVVAPEALAQGKPLKVAVNVHLIDPASTDFGAKRLTALVWTAGLDPERTQRLFPPQAAAKGVSTGRGVASCIVGPDGGLTVCKARAADPDGLGFSEAAVQVAQVMKMNPWTDDGGPVDGAVVNLPIRFNLAHPSAPKAAP